MRIMDTNTLSGFARKTAESTSDFASVVRNLILGPTRLLPARSALHAWPRPEMARQASALVNVRC